MATYEVNLETEKYIALKFFVSNHDSLAQAQDLFIVFMIEFVGPD